MRITKKQLEYFLYKFKLDKIIYSYKQINLHDTYEYVYKIRLYGCYDIFYLYSSIDINTDISRDYSEDRIRCVRFKSGKYTRVFQINRSFGCFVRLENRLKSIVY